MTVMTVEHMLTLWRICMKIIKKTAQDLLHDVKPYAAQMHDLVKDAVSIWKDIIDTGLDQYISRTEHFVRYQ